MLGVTGFNSREDVRHERRVLSEAELVRLIQAAENGRVLYHMSGPMRAMAYRLAVGTGFRANEIRTLSPESFRLDAAHPRIILRPAG
jgi:integrase